MPKREEIKKVMVVGSGPIIIGQAAEFDYAGTQACRSLKEEGLEVVLINSNPATIMTDTNIADRVYVEPLTVDFAARVIERERPDGLLPTLGGQTGLNLAVALAEAGIIDRYGVELLGTSLQSIKKAEDRELFRELMSSIDEPVPESAIIEDIESAREFAGNVGFPVIIRPAYTLGGTGGGIAHDMAQLEDIAHRGLKMSMIGQILLERCVLGWKEIEYEVMRDGADNCITVCNMENLDPMGVHTGDSIVVAPSQTLSDREYQMLRNAALKIITALEIEGGCNVQMALDPHSFDYFIIEVNPRVSRSSALASKATGYPIARVAAKIAIGLHLDEIANAVTGKTLACFEPALDYVVTKIPRWPFDKFPLADRAIGTQMKATGEVMSIGRNFESSLMKAVRSLENGAYSLRHKDIGTLTEMELENRLKVPTDERLFVLAEAFRRGQMVEEIHQLTGIDRWFLQKIRDLVGLEEKVRNRGFSGLDRELLEKYKELGFSDRDIAELVEVEEDDIRALRKTVGVLPVYKIVDTCAAEFEADTPYYYSSYEQENEAVLSSQRRVVVIGSGPIRIGQGIEFDYCSVHSVWALREEGFETIIINNNPETVSTDFDTSDKLYFEPLTEEDVLNIIDQEQPEGVIVQFGGQTAINLADTLARHGVKILGTSVEFIDMAEDRKKFERLLRELDIPKPDGRTAVSVEGALEIAREIDFPVLVRPSYVLGGRAMEIVYNEKDLLHYMKYAVNISPRHPILIDKYVLGKEVEVDVISDGTDVLLPGIMEHIERAGVHSGDSMAVYPPQKLSDGVKKKVVDYATRLSRALHVKGLMNIQFVVDGEDVYILEVNPRASRTIPYLSKITGVPMVNVATKVMVGHTLKELGYCSGLYPETSHVAVKAPVFSFAKLISVDISLSPEMKSTGEIMGVDPTFEGALYKAMVASGLDVDLTGAMIVTVADQDKAEALPIIRGFKELGFEIYATGGTCSYLQDEGMSAARVMKISEGTPNLLDLIRTGKVNLLLNTLSPDKMVEKEAARIRRCSVEHSVPCLTSLDTAAALLYALKAKASGRSFESLALTDYDVDRKGELRSRNSEMGTGC